MRNKEIATSLIFAHFKKLTKPYAMDHTFTLLIFMGEKKSLQQGTLLFLLLVKHQCRWGEQLTSHRTVIAKMTSKVHEQSSRGKKPLVFFIH